MLTILLFVQLERITALTETLEIKTFYPCKWFYDSYMVLNPRKCCYVSFGSNPDKSNLILEDSTKIPSAEEYVVLGVTTDNRLTFYNHLKNLFKKLQTS